MTAENKQLSDKLKQIRQPLVDVILDSLRKGEIPWQKPWHQSVPTNAKTNKHYRGINRFHLMIEMMAHGYTDPRWMTFNQAKEAGYKIMKKPEDWEGNYGVSLECWKLYDRKTKKTMNYSDFVQLDEETKRELEPRLVWKNYPFTVFNASRIEGIEPLIPQRKIYPKEHKAGIVLQELSAAMNVQVVQGYPSACYAPKADCVYMPSREDFHSFEGYGSTLLHELSHATGHESRLNRPLSGSFGSEEYAKEELNAEISSMFMCQDLQIEMDPQHIETHQAYIQSWIKVLENDPNELYQAIRNADQINEYMIRVGKLERLLPQEKELTYEEVLNRAEREDLPLRCIRIGGM